MSLHPSKPAPTESARRTSLRTFSHRTLLLGSVGLILAGCQATSAPVTQTTYNNGTILDFNQANPQVQRSQSAQFAKAMADNAAARQARFDAEGQLVAESAAKARLVAAIRQHMHRPSTAVADIHYVEAPAVAESSIDKGADSLLDSFIKTIGYQKEQSYNDYDDYDSDYDEDYPAADAEAAAAHYEYDEDYDRAVETIEYEDELALARAEVAAAQAELDGLNDDDEYDYNDESYDYDDYDDYDYEEEDSSIERLRSGITTDYIEMKRAEKADNTDDEDAGMMQMMLDMIKRTDEQVAADDWYQNQYVTLSGISEHDPKSRTLRSVYSYDYLAPTVQSSIQLPLMLDFSQKRMTVDASAIKPLFAMTSSISDTQQASKLQNALNKEALIISFGLPEALAENLPVDVLYDAFIHALDASFAEIPASVISDVSAQPDAFASQLGASQVLKVNFDSKQTGAMLGRMVKYMSKDLQQYVEAHPEMYADKEQLSEMLDRLSLYNEGYNSADMGALLQLIEAIAPLSLNQNNYYYLDRAGSLLGKQQRFILNSPFLNVQQTAVSQVRYNAKDFNKHPLAPLLTSSFDVAQGAPKPVDGNQLFADMKKEKGYAEAARYARYDYDTYSDSYGYANYSDDAGEYSEYDNDNDTYSDEAYLGE